MDEYYALKKHLLADIVILLLSYATKCLII